MIPSLHPAHSQQNIWKTWYKDKYGQMHQTTPSEKEDTQSRDGDTRRNQPNRDYNICCDNEDNTDSAETTTEVSDDDDLTAILDLPLAKSNRGDIMDDKKEPHTDMNKEDLVAKMELLTNDPNLYDRKHMTNKMTRCGGGLNDEDTKQEVLSKVGNMTLTDTRK